MTVHHPDECARYADMFMLGSALMTSHFREIRALRLEFKEFARQSAERERALKAEVDALRQALLEPGVHGRNSKDEGLYSPSPGDLKEPSTSSHTSPSNTPAPGVEVPLIILDDATTPIPSEHRREEGYGGRYEEEGGKLLLHAEKPDTDDGSGSERDMELATPLYQTILSLAGDELAIPLLPPTVQSSAVVDPADVPLPFSPDSITPSTESLLFLPLMAPVATSTPPPHSPGLPLALSHSPTLSVEPLHIPAHLLARTETAIQARVDAIQIEFEEANRELDTRTRELQETEAALVGLRQTTTRLHTQLALDRSASPPAQAAHAQRDGCPKCADGARGADAYSNVEGDSILVRPQV